MILITKKIVLFALIMLLLNACSHKSEIRYESESNSILYENILLNFTTEQGLIKTDLKERQNEFLSESQGLLMQYFLQQNMKANFNLSTEVVKNQFLLKNQTISWRIKNDEKSPSNALIDDLRMIEVFMHASEKWGNPQLKKFANQIIKGNKKYTMKNGYLVNFSSIEEKTRSNEINLSYINKEQYEFFQFPKSQLNTQIEILEKAPMSINCFYPLKFNIKKKQYQFENEVHMVDQLLTSINIAGISPKETRFYEEVKKRFDRDGKIFGKYDLNTGVPSVNYESPAVYSYAIQLARLNNDDAFEKQLFKRLNLLRNQNEESRYFDTFISEDTKDTHVFDNLMPLLIEEGNQ